MSRLFSHIQKEIIETGQYTPDQVLEMSYPETLAAYYYTPFYKKTLKKSNATKHPTTI
jgi:hypothetical protein|tara:strand:- start:699 stop:872 length:174 start_codon:yes stop_codon:yes gene_type:complete